VRDCHVVCPYHGWSYDGDGRLVDIPHDLFGHKWPKFSVGSFPVRERYGLVWMFPGDPERADKVAMPEIPEIEGPDAWACVPVDFVWKCHHSMVIDNVSDFTHAYLHRRFEPFKDAKLTNLQPDGDRVFVEYDTVIGGGKLYNRFIDTSAVNTGHIKLCYEYPHQWSNTGDAIKEWCLVLPIDERTTRTFFLFYYKQFKIPFTPLRIPQRLMKSVLRVANEVLMKPLLREDGVACEAEQDGYERHFDAPIAEFNPAVNAFQDLTIRKWQEHLDERDALPKTHRLPVAPRFGCAV
jgi:phenylpropionate dioxygenase-like ring-hydroxylating dioxygenase large terminal subunit